MSVSLEEVLNAGGYDINTYSDAVWFWSKRKEIEQLLEKAEFTVDQEIDRQNEIAEMESVNETNK